MESCYLFLGPELGEKQDAVDTLRSDWGAGEPLEEDSYYAGETPMSEIVSVLRNGSLFSPRRLVFIKNAENIKKKDEIEALAAYLTSPADNTMLILLSEGNSLAKPIENAAPPGGKRMFWEMFENRKRGWLSDFFRRQGFSICDDGVDAVLDLVENNTEALRRECSRLCQFLDKDKLVLAADVEKWLSRTREESTFTLFSRLCHGDLSKSLETLRALLLAKEAPSAIFASLSWCFQTLRDYLFLSEESRGGGAADFSAELKKIGLSSAKKRADYEHAARLYNAWSADTCLALTAEYDMLLRSSGQGLEGLLMDRYVYKIWRLGFSA